MSALSVVVPALDEVATLPALLADLRAQQGVALEVIVADGGSRDATVALARDSGARVVNAARGRGAQMNAGAAGATAAHLLFLHADSRLTSPTQLREALAAMPRQPRVAGHFALRFARAQPGHDFFFRWLEAKTRSGRPGTIHGDQGLLIARDDFGALGGFDISLPFMEDARLARKIFAGGRWVLLPGELVTSARRFEAEGHAERLTLMALMQAAEAAGLHEFFEVAPQIYRAQSDAARLCVAPFARQMRRLIRARGGRGGLRLWMRGGRYVRHNAWQLFYRRDLARGDGDARCLRFHDRWFAPLFDHAAGDALAALLSWLWLIKISLTRRPHRAEPIRRDS